MFSLIVFSNAILEPIGVPPSQHDRLPVKAGGREVEENLVHLYHTCHQYLHNNENVVLNGLRLEQLDGMTVTSRS